jgi:3-deoxy-D-manno-octulosonic-acid transferase
MRNVLDALYLIGLLLLVPWLIFKALTAGKFRRGLKDKLLGLSPNHLATRSPGQVAWFHGVSVGEIHLLRTVVAAFRQRHSNWQCVVSTTTDTGFDEARRRFPNLAVVYFPFDFSWAVARSLRAVRPSLIVLAESELWPNYLMAAKRRGIPVALINGRMSPRSFGRYRRLRPIVRFLLQNLDVAAVQTQEYAEALCDLGAEATSVHVTGNIKYDGVTTRRDNPQTQQLRALLNVKPDDLVWISGSTQAPEEEVALRIFQRLRPAHPHLRLLLVPRQKDRFDEVATLLERSRLPFVRRTMLQAPLTDTDGVVLVDTIGELSALWGLADIAFVGGSLDGKRGGQNMIEPAAYGVAVVFGAHVWNFRDTVDRLLAANAAVQVADETELEAAVRGLADDGHERQRLGTAAQQFVSQQQGATTRTLDLLDKLLPAGAERTAA